MLLRPSECIVVIRGGGCLGLRSEIERAVAGAGGGIMGPRIGAMLLLQRARSMLNPMGSSEVPCGIGLSMASVFCLDSAVKMQKGETKASETMKFASIP